MKQGVLYQIYITNNVELHKLVLPKEYQHTMLFMLQDDYGHPRLECTLVLVKERFYWSTMYQDVTEYVTNCHVAKGIYTGPNTKQGSLVANSFLDLLCIDVLKIDPSKDGKEKLLVLTDTFTKFSQAFVAINQEVLTVTRILVNKWFYVYGIPASIHSNKGQNFENDIISNLYSMNNINQTMTIPYKLCGHSICKRFNLHCYIS